jgi:hypothetical protein
MSMAAVWGPAQTLGLIMTGVAVLAVVVVVVWEHVKHTRPIRWCKTIRRHSKRK